MVPPMIDKPSTFVVLAVDPDAPWRSQRFDFLVYSAIHAKRLARAELAKDKRDHWSVAALRAA